MADNDNFSEQNSAPFHGVDILPGMRSNSGSTRYYGPMKTQFAGLPSNNNQTIPIGINPELDLSAVTIERIQTFQSTPVHTVSKNLRIAAKSDNTAKHIPGMDI